MAGYRDLPMNHTHGNMDKIGETAGALSRGYAVNKNTTTGAAELATSGFPDGVTQQPYAAEEQVAGQYMGRGYAVVNGASANVAYKARLKVTTGGVMIPADTAGDYVCAISIEPTTITTDGVLIPVEFVRFHYPA